MCLFKTRCCLIQVNDYLFISFGNSKLCLLREGGCFIEVATEKILFYLVLPVRCSRILLQYRRVPVWPNITKCGFERAMRYFI